MHLSHYKSVLERAGVIFAPGMIIDEIRAIEGAYQFRFPPDLRDFLMFALPVSNGFLNWRDASPAEVQRSLTWPYEGMCTDIIYYGCNLFDYLENEFSYYFGRSGYQLDNDIKPIEFWSDLAG
jgi:hypothetical protein